MLRSIPNINAPRVSLRGMRAEDFNRFAEIWAMPEVTEHICGKPRPKGESWEKFLSIAGHWQISGFGYWGVEHREVKKLVGQVGFRYGTWGFGDDFDPYPEAGWVLAPDAHGQGLGIEAVRAAHDWFDRIISTQTVCLIAPENAASIRLAEAMGYHPLRDTEVDGGPVRLFSRKGPRF